MPCGSAFVGSAAAGAGEEVVAVEAVADPPRVAGRLRSRGAGVVPGAFSSVLIAKSGMAPGSEGAALPAAVGAGSVFGPVLSGAAGVPVGGVVRVLGVKDLRFMGRGEVSVQSTSCTPAKLKVRGRHPGPHARCEPPALLERCAGWRVVNSFCPDVQ
ncbi:hypothetical protein DB346_07330 [Verrucomicrobia bacterium LW23]|nr:hypothetical protein DB346_07330 [Verrucomicrobia bacterium LW23]